MKCVRSNEHIECKCVKHERSQSLGTSEKITEWGSAHPLGAPQIARKVTPCPAACTLLSGYEAE